MAKGRKKAGFCEGVVDMDQYYTTGEFARMAHDDHSDNSLLQTKKGCEAELY